MDNNLNSAAINSATLNSRRSDIETLNNATLNSASLRISTSNSGTLIYCNVKEYNIKIVEHNRVQHIHAQN